MYIFDLQLVNWCWISCNYCRNDIDSIHIRKEVNCMKRDGGAYCLPTTYDRILVTCSSATSQHPVTTCLMKFDIGEHNVAIRYRFCVWSCNVNVIIVYLLLSSLIGCRCDDLNWATLQWRHRPILCSKIHMDLVIHNHNSKTTPSWYLPTWHVDRWFADRFCSVSRPAVSWRWTSTVWSTGGI